MNICELSQSFSVMIVFGYRFSKFDDRVLYRIDDRSRLRLRSRRITDIATVSVVVERGINI